MKKPVYAIRNVPFLLRMQFMIVGILWPGG